jgi:hypothetical protein
MEEKLSSKQMILDIASMRSRAIELLNKNKRYNPLLKALTEKDFYYDDDQPLPGLKELANLSGLKYDKVRRYLKEIYHDLVLDDEAERLFKYKEVEYFFSVKGYQEYIYFTSDSLPVVPRIGEMITVPYFKAYLKTDYFHVEDVRHTLQDGKQVIDISLKVGSYNLYWHFRKDQAEEEGEISILDMIHLSDTQLKKKLNIGRYKDW